MPVRKTSPRPRKVAEPLTFPAPAPATPKPPRLFRPAGTWTMVRFEHGVTVETIELVIIEQLVSERARRQAGDLWVVESGEYFMNEGAPVLAFSPDVPKELINRLREFFEMCGPFTTQRADARKLAFRGRALLWLQDDFQKMYPTPHAQDLPPLSS